MAAVSSAIRPKVEYSLAASESRDAKAKPEDGLADFEMSGIARPLPKGRSAPPAAQKPCKSFVYKSLNCHPFHSVTRNLYNSTVALGSRRRAAGRLYICYKYQMVMRASAPWAPAFEDCLAPALHLNGNWAPGLGGCIQSLLPACRP